MYSSWWKPEGDESEMLTNHDALHRDAATHSNIQSNEDKFRPLDLETIMSSNAVVKFWYLHRPKTMAFVHKNAVKIQSIGRSFAARRLIEKHGIAHTVEIAKKDAKKREVERLAQLSEEEIRKEAEEERVLEERRAEKKRMQVDKSLMAVEDEISVLENASWLTEKLAKEELAVLKQKEQDAMLEKAILAERLREEQKLADDLQAQVDAKEAARENANMQREEMEELQRKENVGNTVKGDIVDREVELKETEDAMEKAFLIAQQAAEDAEAVRVAKADAEQQSLMDEAYENSLGKLVPVHTPYGKGVVKSYNKESGMYAILIEDGTEKYEGEESIAYLQHSELELDDSRILSPKTHVDTPFGTGSVVGLDPHAGCYAIESDCMGEHSNGMAYVGIEHVVLHKEEQPTVVIDDKTVDIPNEITIKSANIVDSRVVSRTGKKFVQYKLEIETTNYSTVYCWKRYSTFRALCEQLIKEKGFKKRDLPELPHRHIIGNFSQRMIAERALRLNEFLDAAVHADHLQWGIKVNDEISVYKRRVKNNAR